MFYQSACRQVRDGARVIGLKDGDTLGFAAQCNEDNVMMVACSQGKVSSYLAKEIPVRAGRATRGVRAKSLKKGVFPLYSLPCNEFGVLRRVLLFHTFPPCELITTAVVALVLITTLRNSAKS